MNIELNLLQQQILASQMNCAFVFTLSEEAKGYVLEQGTDYKYGARHLKRTIGRLLIRPLSNLVSSKQVHAGDWLLVDVDQETSPRRLRFIKRAEGMSTADMASPANLMPAISTFLAETQAKHRAAS